MELYSGNDGLMALYGACTFVALILIFVFIIKIRRMKKK